MPGTGGTADRDQENMMMIGYINDDANLELDAEPVDPNAAAKEDKYDEDEEEEEKDDYEVGNEFFVLHGYLSDEEKVGFWENYIKWLYGTNKGTKTADSEAVPDAREGPSAAQATVEQADEDAHGDAHETEDPNTSSMEAINGYKAVQDARDKNLSSPE